jgi:diguanylate cyclase (GGDEF)-like protein
MRAELERRATYDPLTGIRNRASIMSVLEETVRGAESLGGVAVLFVDLDGFKAVNDRLGHAVGDQLLAVTAQRIQSAVRAEDVVGRIGGDEFLVVCPGIPAAEAAVQLAERVARRAREPALLTGRSLALQASVGVAWTDDGMGDADDLVALADAAMYESKMRRAGTPVLSDGVRRRPICPGPSGPAAAAPVAAGVAGAIGPRAAG